MEDESGQTVGKSWGVPTDGAFDASSVDTMGGPGVHHWRQSTITEPGLDARGGVFFAAVEMTRMPMVLSDPNLPDNPIVFANNAFLDLTGYEEAEIVGRNCRFLQGAQTDRAAVAALREAIEARTAIALEILNYRRDGSPFWNAVFMGPVFDQQGELLYFFASQLDVTRRRESEQAFRQAQKMEAIGQLTAGLAHDFNNLLHVVTGSLERIAANPSDRSQTDRYVRAAATATERGAKLTKQLLAFARRSRLEPKAVNVTELVTGIAELLDSSAGSKAELQLHLTRRLPEVQLDPVHLEMALLNIVVNARDAMPDGGAITVATGLKRIEPTEAPAGLEPGDYVVLSVADEGIGMPEHVKARATEPFFTTKAPGEGTGLGLAMAHGFADQSGGRLEIDSEPQRGAVVRLLFPVAAVRKPSAGVPGDGGYQPSVVDELAPPRILVVDDSPEIADLARATLTDTGYAVTVVHSGEAALKAFDTADKPFDLVFSDVVMPGGMNGLVLAQEIRKRSPTVPLLMTTGYNDQMALDGPQPEAMDVIGKPYRRSERLDRVQAALRRAEAAEPRRTSDFGVVEA